MEGSIHEELLEIVIVGGGICGLATALALHRKGIKSVVLERANSLRDESGAIGISANGWRALDQLGLSVSDHLRKTSVLIERAEMRCLNNITRKEIPFGSGETRCLKRGYLINTLAKALPSETIHFGCTVISVEFDSTLTVLHLFGGKTIKTKIVIGCDGSRSVIGKFLGLNPIKQFPHSAVRGLTNYPKGHNFKHEFIRWMKDDSSSYVGRIPIDDKCVYWFVSQKSSLLDIETWNDHDQEHIRGITLEYLVANRFPKEVMEMIKMSEADSISFTRNLKYRAPWDLVLGNFRKGTVTVAGDAWHVIGPFLGQGGSAGLEDAIVLARRLSHAILGRDDEMNYGETMMKRVGEAMDGYVKERKKRLLGLSTQSYLTGIMIQGPQIFIKILVVFVMIVLFRDQEGHAKYDCGRL